MGEPRDVIVIQVIQVVIVVIYNEVYSALSNDTINKM